MGEPKGRWSVELLVGAYALVATVAIVLPSLVYVEHRLEASLLDEQIEQLVEDEEAFVETTSRRLAAAERSVVRLARRISSIPSSTDPGDVARFAELVATDPDGARRSRRDRYSPRDQAGIWIPRHGALDDSLAAWFVRAKAITEESVVGVDEPLFVNAWVLPLSRGEVIHWPDAPGFIYSAPADHDYVDSDWVGLARPERNPRGEPRWTRAEFDPVPRIWMISVVAPYRRDGEFAGSVGHDVPLDRLIGAAPARVRRHDATFLIVDADRRVLVSSRDRAAIVASAGTLTIDRLPDDTLRPIVQSLLHRADPRNGAIREETPTHVVLGTRVEATSWFVVSAVPRAAIGARIAAPLMTMRIATLVALGLVLVASVVTIAQDRRRKRDADAALRASEAKLLQAQKMEAVGRLAGGIAHDFNNLITAITAFAQIARRRVPAGDDVLREHLHQIERAALRGADLTRQLLAFARRQPIRPRVVDLNALVVDVHKLLRRLIGEDVELVTLPAGEPACVNIDPSQFEQVLTNLAVNARDAMPDGGRLTISIEVDRSDVILRVEDQGIGMSDEVKRRIFEPFFTTKEVGRGTGLGLSTCFAIVDQSHGKIDVDSVTGRGTRFVITLPRVFEQPTETRESRASLESRATSGVVLVVEDDPLVRKVVRDVLSAHGFDVLEANNGAVAIELVDRHHGRLDCVLTDVVMPVASGGDLVRSLRRDYPRIPIVVMSGYVDDALLLDEVSSAQVDFLEKPFTPEELLARISDAVAKAPRHAKLEAVR